MEKSDGRRLIKLETETSDIDLIPDRDLEMRSTITQQAFRTVSIILGAAT